MLTPEEKKEIREMADSKFTDLMQFHNRIIYSQGMEDGILQERERREAEIARIKDLLRDSVISYGITDGLGGLSKEEYWQEYKKENNL